MSIQFRQDQMTEAVADLLKRADAEWMAKATMAMVEIPSVTMDEAEMCRWYERALRDLGLDVDVREVTPGRNNLYARIPGAGGGPTLALNGHVDTVPILSAWPPRREGDLIYGRGTTDMKGPMAAVLGAAKALLDSGMRLKGDLVISAVVGHEEAIARKDGPRAYIDDLNAGRTRADRILIVEGMDEIWLMSMGSANFTITLTSDTGGTHTNNTPFGENPIRFMGELIGAINRRQQEMDAGDRHPLAGPERIDLGIAAAGDLYNRTPTHCTLVGTRRWMPGRTVADVTAELERLVRPFAEAGKLGLDIRIEQEREPFETPAEDAAVQAVLAAAEQVTGRRPGIVGRRIVGDANLYVHGTGIPTFYYGASNHTAMPMSNGSRSTASPARPRSTSLPPRPIAASRSEMWARPASPPTPTLPHAPRGEGVRAPCAPSPRGARGRVGVGGETRPFNRSR
jgi:acetylornithine deacetylase/succinyl-diaminopimelate desuccinylase-like protein